MLKGEAMKVIKHFRRLVIFSLICTLGTGCLVGCQPAQKLINSETEPVLSLVPFREQGLVMPEIPRDAIEEQLLSQYHKWRNGNHYDADGNLLDTPGYVQNFQIPEAFALPWERIGKQEGAVVVMVPNGTASELPGDYCVSTDEAMGYGMMIAAQFGDWTLFDQLLRVSLYYANYNQERFNRTGNGWCESMTTWAIPAKKGKDWFGTSYFQGLPSDVQEQWRENGVQYDPLYLEGTTIKESVIVGETNDVRNSGGSATDGELDIAYALYLAAANFKGDKERATGYLNLARTRFDAIMTEVVDTYGYLSDQPNRAMRFLPSGDYRISYLDGDQYRNEAITRPCDWMNGQIRTYFNDTKDPRAQALIEANYAHVSQLADTKTGFVPDFAYFSKVNGLDTLLPASETISKEWQSDLFYMNSARYPFRMAMDYYHYKDQRGINAALKIVNYLIETYKFEVPEDFEAYPPAMHHLNGTADPSGLWQNPVLNAAIYAAMSMSDNDAYQDYVTMGWNHLANRFDSRFYDWDGNGLQYDPMHSGYFQDTWALMSLLVMSGHWSKPELTIQ